jgi:hypothetical protein
LNVLHRVKPPRVQRAVEAPVEKLEKPSPGGVNQQRGRPWRVVPVMSDAPPIPVLSRRELIERWTVTFGEPPPVVHDQLLMLALVEADLAVRRPAEP